MKNIKNHSRLIKSILIVLALVAVGVVAYKIIQKRRAATVTIECCGRRN